MARSDLMRALGRALRLAARLDHPDPAVRRAARRALAEPDAPPGRRPDTPGPASLDRAPPLGRRSLLLGAASGAAACATGATERPAPSSPPVAPPPSASASACASASASAVSRRPRVLVVGAGLAGLTCAYRLRSAPVELTLIEARPAAGGRVATERRVFAPLVAELGGEFIDTGHAHLRALCQELALPLDDRTPDGDPPLSDRYFFGGRAVGERELVAALAPAARAMRREVEGLGPLDAPHRSARLREREAAVPSIAAWLKASRVEGLGRALLEAAFVTELGRELDELAWLPMLQMFALDEAARSVSFYGESDERYTVRGGNDLVATRLATALGERLRPGHALRQLARDPDGRLRATVDRDATSRAEVADVVVLALPFSVLRASRRLVALDPSLDLPPLQRQAIDELAYGSNAKLIVGLRRRDWLGQKMSGSVFTDLPFQSTWDSARRQPGEAGLLTSFRGGRAGEALRPEAAAAEQARLLTDLRRAAPSVRWEPSRGGPALVADWPSPGRGVFGSYSTYGPGQPGRFGGLEGATAGNLVFAGEHTSAAAQGYMEGAVESGDRAAAEVRRLLGLAG